MAGTTTEEEQSVVNAWLNARSQLRDAAMAIIAGRDNQVPATTLNSLRQAHVVAAQEYLYQAARLLDELGGDARFWLVPLGGAPLRPEDVHALERAIAVGQEEMCRLFRALSAASQLLQRERDQLIELWPRSMISGGSCKSGA
ncbi:hypothetical protein GSI_00902 [Ganoderma sinense ZZ0214-1]|uniref:Uncharacterized protein n=1 Tax=Ganoderma sinense ZZ0214-1 TaxID=1077348 RepID=A0A2G8STV1_9APHY|nr:hypothetical protein GSI_00902 [Ganoderma sinense ZZ0214-1]